MNRPTSSTCHRKSERALPRPRDRAASGVASALQARGIQPGDKVSLLIPNVPDFTIAYFGILYAGATVVPINVLLKRREIAYLIEDTAAKDFALAFHERLRSGEAPSSAARAARLELRDAGSTPVDWAAFRLSGRD